MYDFVFDGCANGQKLKCLTVVDELSKESLFIDVAGSTRSQQLIEVLEKLISKRGCPLVLRSDNGPEFLDDVSFEKNQIGQYEKGNQKCMN